MSLSSLISNSRNRNASRMSTSKLIFITDVEGNWRYMERLLQISKSFYLDKTTQEFALADDSMLVYGGDAGDKGIHTLRVYTKLVQLKKLYPDRVILLAGNRDINKMRLISELVDNREMNLTYMAKGVYVWNESTCLNKADDRDSRRTNLGTC